MDYGIKVSRPGFDVKTATPAQLAFSSKYQTLKVHSQHSGEIKDSTGRTITIAHGLGYKPMFVVHGEVYPSDLPDTFFLAPYTEGGVYPLWASQTHLYAYADNTNIYIKASDDFGWEGTSTGGLAEDLSYEYSAYGGSCQNEGVYVGYDDGGRLNFKGGIRFDPVYRAKSASVYRARMGFYIGGRYTSNTIYTNVYGIDEDDTSPFGCATSRSKTSASYSPSVDGSLQDGDTWATDVTNCFNEIINRSGWSSGNAMGFLIENNGTTGTDNYIFDFYGSDLHTLKWLSTDHLLDYKCTIYKNRIDI